MAQLYLTTQQVGLYLPMAYASAATATMSSLSKRLGRETPCQSGQDTILAECARDIYTVDEWGEPFPSGTVWVRTRFGYASEGMLDQYWIPVPEVLPAGYTLSLMRNTLPPAWYGAGTPATGLGKFLYGTAGASVAEAAGTYSPINTCIRTADGLYMPLGFDANSAGVFFPWGPHVRYNKGFSYVETTMSDGANRGDYTPAHPGYRAVRISVTAAKASFEFATYVTSVTVGIDGVTVTIPRASFTLVGSLYSYDVPTVFTPSLPAAGHYVNYPITCYSTGGSAINPPFGVNCTLKCSPRVDIPLPWFASTGDVCAPGGILTGGNIPGY